MLLKDFLCSPDFDVNCNYEVYHCSGRGATWLDGGKLVFSTLVGPDTIPKTHPILDKKISYITLAAERGKFRLIIEVV